MSGFKEKTWKKWKETKTIPPVVAVTDKKSTDSTPSQRSSSLIRSKKRDTTRNAANNILAAENQGIIKPRTPIGNGRNKRATTNIKDQCDANTKNDFKNQSTSPFNTIAPTNPFYRENVIIVQYGEVKEDNAHFALDAQESAELWDELPPTEVAENAKPTRKKSPKGGSRHPANKSHHQPTAPFSSPVNEKVSPPAQVPPQTASKPSAPSGSSASHASVPQSGLSHHPRTKPSSDLGDGTCDFPECPARGPKQKERLCMAPECPVTLKKAVVKEAKKAMKRSNGKKKKNPLTILGAALMSTFAGHDSSCKLTKEEKRALKRMKQADEDDDDDQNTTPVKAKKSRGVQCKAPILQKTERAHRGPETADKSTTCDIPECSIAKQKTKIKEFMDKGQLCDIPSCPVKEPPPRKEKKVETPKGCPSKPCTLKTKDEEFLKQLDPSIFEKLPRLKMTCDQALAEENEEQSRLHHTPSATKNKNKPSSNKTKERDKGVKIVAAHVHVSASSKNPFLPGIPNTQDFPAANELTVRHFEQNPHNSETASEYQKLVGRRLSTSAFVSEEQSNDFKSPNSRPLILSQERTSIIGTEDEISRLQSTAKISETIGSRLLYFFPNKSESARSENMRPAESIEKYSNYVADNETSLSQNPALKTVGTARFNDKIHEPSTVKQSAFGKRSNENGSKKMPLNIFVAEPITTNPSDKSKPESEPVRCLSKTMSATENVAGVCSTQRHVTTKPSREIQTKTPVTSRNTINGIKPQDDMILDKNTLESLRRVEKTCSIPSVEHVAATVSSRNPIIPNQVTVSNAQSRKFNNSGTSDGTYTQTLTTSAVSPNELNTIGVGDGAIIDFDSKILASDLK